MERDECYGLGWNGMKPSLLGPELHRVRLEQLGLILVPNARHPTELIERVLLASKEVRAAFTTFMQIVSTVNTDLVEQYHQLLRLLSLTPIQQENGDNEEQIPYFDEVKRRSRRRIIEGYSAVEDAAYPQRWHGETRTFHMRLGPVPRAQRTRSLKAAVCEFVQTLHKARSHQATKVQDGDMARSLDDVRADDVWGNYAQLPDDLEMDASHLILQVLIQDWLALATASIPRTLVRLRAELAAHIPHGHNAYLDLFNRLHGRIDAAAPGRGGFDADTFCSLLHMQRAPSFRPAPHFDLELFRVEFTRMWACESVVSIRGNLIAAIWEETSRDLGLSADAADADAADGTGGGGCDVAGVLRSLCYALTTESPFVMGLPGRNDGRVDEYGNTEQDYGQHRPPIPDAVHGTSWRIVDAVRVALHEINGIWICHENDVSAVFSYMSRQQSNPRQLFWIAQCIVWHAVLDWFCLPRLEGPELPASHRDILIQLRHRRRRQRSSTTTTDTPIPAAADDYDDDDGDDNDTVRDEAMSEATTETIVRETWVHPDHPDIMVFENDADNADDDFEVPRPRFIINTITTPLTITPVEGAPNTYICEMDGARVTWDADATPPSSTGSPNARQAGNNDNDNDSENDNNNNNDDDDNNNNNNSDNDNDNDNDSQNNPPWSEPPRQQNGFAVPDHVISFMYNRRPRQPITHSYEQFASDAVQDHEAALHGVGPFLYVRASGDDENIVLPPHLVDTRRCSGNADGIEARQLVVDTMPDTMPDNDNDNDNGHPRPWHISYEHQDLIVASLCATFPLAPPLIDRLPLPANVRDHSEFSLKAQAIAAIIRSMELQFCGGDDSEAAAEIEPLDMQELYQSISESNLEATMVEAVAAHGRRIGVDLRLGLVADRCLPAFGPVSTVRPVTKATRFIWIHGTYALRCVGGVVVQEQFAPLKPMESLVGHGRESHFWLGVRQEVFRTWHI